MKKFRKITDLKRSVSGEQEKTGILKNLRENKSF
jgi:hypothetical protein